MGSTSDGVSDGFVNVARLCVAEGCSAGADSWPFCGVAVGNGWLFQEITNRLPGRVDATSTSFASTADLGAALRRAAAAHGEHEKRNGGKHDENWPDWYAEYMVREQSGEELPL